MTAETSNARGDVPYDRELIARMLDVCGHPKYTLDAYREQSRLLREADNASAQAETVSRPPAAARGDVRIIARDIHYAIMDAGLAPLSNADNHKVREAILRVLQAALAAEGVQAGEVVELRRQLYLLGGERDRYKNLADRASEVQDRMQRAIDEARSQQPAAKPFVGVRCPECDAEYIASEAPEPRGVADEELSHADLCRLSRVFNDHNELHLTQDRRINEWLGKRIAESLTGERNG